VRRWQLTVGSCSVQLVAPGAPRFYTLGLRLHF
jgi:hypothetical protein